MTLPDQDRDYDSSDNEDAPLLSSAPDSPTLTTFPQPPRPNGHSRTSSYIHLHTTHSPRIITGIVLVILFILGFGGYLMAVPGIRIYEDIICHHYYAKKEGEGFIGFGDGIDESLCKGDEVQNELSIVVAGLHVIGAIPSLVTTIPYGLLADRIGRKPVFIMAISGLVLCAMWQMCVMWFWRTLPLRLVWLGPILTFIGGGEAVAAMDFYAIACDITPEANRANVFFLGVSAGLVAELIAPSIAALLMKTSNWIPLILGTLTLVFGTLLIFLIPETLHMRPRPSNPSHLTPSPSNLDLDQSSNTKKSTSILVSIKNEFETSLKTLSSSLSVLHSAPIIILLGTFIVQPFAGQSVDLSLRYISTRFHFPLRLSSLLLSLRAGVNIVLLLIILPLLSHFLTKKLKFSSAKKDLVLARASFLIMTLGILIIAASPTLPLTVIGMAIFTLGMGCIALTRSLITSLIEREHIGQLYAMISVVEVTGALISGPSLAKLYIVGLRMKGAWVGLPFFGVAIICIFSVVGIWMAGCVMERRGWGRDLKGENGEVENGEVEEEEESVLVDVDVGETGTVNIV